MDSSPAERYRRADAIFDAALDITPAERAAFVARACDGDASVRSDVERLLRAHDRSNDFLRAAAADLAGPLLDNPVIAEGAMAITPPPARIGPYRIVREIGRGGMGVVYLAERDDPTFQQTVALKVVRGSSTTNRADVERFFAERQLLVSLEHPNIARLFDGGLTADGLPYYTMVYCEGGSLAERLRAEGALPIEETMRIARQLTGALAAAHARGVLHRDVKPANVLFDADGSVRLTDFGIAKLLGDDSSRPSDVMGTVAYLAPEQLRGEHVDVRTDLWALGVTLYEMITGRRPFTGQSYAAVMHQIVSTTPDLPSRVRPGLPSSLDALVIRLLEKDPAARPTNAVETLALLDGGGSTRRPVSTSSRRPSIVAFGLALLLLAGIAAYVAWPRASPPARAEAPAAAVTSVAVMPFANTSGDVASEPFTDGLTDELIGTLARLPGLRVTARSSVFALKGKQLGAKTIGDTLGVQYLLEGSVRRAGDRLRVSAQLVKAHDGSVLWSQDYDREVKDALLMQRDIARAMGGALRVQFVLGAGVASPSEDTEANELYLKGRYALNTGTGREDLLRAIRYFEATITRDSNHARAHSGLSDAYGSLANFAYADPREASSKAREAALRALTLDSTLAEARTSLAHVRCVRDYAWDAAEREYRKAIAHDPSYTFARITYAICLSDRSRYAEAVAHLDTAGRLDPLRFQIWAVLGRVYVHAGRPSEAVRPLTKAIDLNPQADLAWEALGHAYLQMNRRSDAIAALRKAALLSGLRDSAQLAYAYAVTGDSATATRIVADLVASSASRYVPPVHVAMAYAGLGRTDDAFRWLERAYQERASFLDGIKVMSAFQRLHGDPRWQSFLGRMGLSP